MRVIILMAVSLLHAATTNAAPQFLTFEDGKIGVNFGGYHAEAGLGGLLTGNAAHGGLSASAGTPWGPKAAAGLGGRLDGRTNGLIYAGAEANPSVGASAVLGGSAGEHGFIGSEAHANGKVSTSSLSSAAQPHISVRSDPVTDGPATIDAIQKIKPPKKYHLIKPEDAHPSAAGQIEQANSNGVDSTNNANNESPALMINVHRQRMRERRRQQQEADLAHEEIERKRSHERRIRNYQRLHPRQRLVTRSKTVDINVEKENNSQAAAMPTPSQQDTMQQDVNVVHSKHLVKSVHKSLGVDAAGFVPGPPPPPTNINSYDANPGVLHSALNIPIGILRVIQESLTGIAQEKSYSG